MFRAFASEDANVSATRRASCRARCAQTTDTLGKVERFAERARPDAPSAAPGRRARSTTPTSALTPFAQRGRRRVLRDDIRPFVRERAAARARPAARRPQASPRPTPDLTRAFAALNHLFNMLGYNPNGREEPGRRRTARRATCSGWPGSTTTATQLFSTPTRTARSARSTVGGTVRDARSRSLNEQPELEFLLRA